MNPKDRRRHPRLEERFSVDLLNLGDDPSVSSFEAIVPAVALDVSRQGVRLQTSYHAAVGTLMSAILYHKGGESICLCEVKWVREEMGERVYGLYVNEWSRLDSALAQRLGGMEIAPVNSAALRPGTAGTP